MKAAIEEKCIDFSIIKVRGSEIGAFIPDIFTRYRCVWKKAKLQDAPRVSAIYDCRDVTRLR